MGKYNHLNFISVLFLDFFEYKIIDLLETLLIFIMTFVNNIIRI